MAQQYFIGMVAQAQLTRFGKLAALTTDPALRFASRYGRCLHDAEVWPSAASWPSLALPVRGGAAERQSYDGVGQLVAISLEDAVRD